MWLMISFCSGVVSTPRIISLFVKFVTPIVHNIRQGHSAHAYNYKYKQMTMGVSDDIIAALETNLSHACH